MYAQSHEDDEIARFFEGHTSGFYVDIGAHDGAYLSNTLLFYERGWRGINVEPHPQSFAKLAEFRPRDVNLNVAVSDREGEAAFYLADFHPLSSFSRSDIERAMSLGYGERYEEIVVRTTTLSRLLDEHVPAGTRIDFMSIDTEG